LGKEGRVPVQHSLRARVYIELGDVVYTFMVPDKDQHARAYRLQAKMEALESPTMDDVIAAQEAASDLILPLVVGAHYNGEPIENWPELLKTDVPFDGPRGLEVLKRLYFRDSVEARIVSGPGHGGLEARPGRALGEVSGGRAPAVLAAVPDAEPVQD
jgi:hypothetical protein